jgi:hypothetical protein
MGTSSGKVPAILDYCRGMGLLDLKEEKRTRRKSPLLTPFGRTVFLEDPYLKENVTQWIAHLNMCSPINGADVWYEVFFNGENVLGQRFKREKLEEYLSARYGTRNTNIIGPLVRMYEDEAAFQRCGVLAESAGIVSRTAAPIETQFGAAYGAWMIQIISDSFEGISQVTVEELDVSSGLKRIPGWGNSELRNALALAETKGMLKVDRNMEPWIIQISMDRDEAWGRIFDDLI